MQKLLVLYCHGYYYWLQAHYHNHPAGFYIRVKLIMHPIMTPWICRLTLLVGVVSMTYIVLLPQYNFAHWVPHGYLKSWGVPYSSQLWIDHHFDKAIHYLGASGLVILLFGAKLYYTATSTARLWWSAIIVLMLVIGAEIAQLIIDRGFSLPDILTGVLGIISSMLLLNMTVLTKHDRANQKR